MMSSQVINTDSGMLDVSDSINEGPENVFFKRPWTQSNNLMSNRNPF